MWTRSTLSARCAVVVPAVAACQRGTEWLVRMLLEEAFLVAQTKRRSQAVNLRAMVVVLMRATALMAVLVASRAPATA